MLWYPAARWKFASMSAFSLPIGNGEPIGQNNLVASFAFDEGSVGSLTSSTVGSPAGGGELVEAFAPRINTRAEDFKRLEVRAGRNPEVTIADCVTVLCLRMLAAASTRQPLEIDWASALS